MILLARETPVAANLSHVDHGGNLQHNHSGGIHDTSHNRKSIYKKKSMSKERDVEMSTVCLLCHLDMCPLPCPGAKGTRGETLYDATFIHDDCNLHLLCGPS